MTELAAVKRTVKPHLQVVRTSDSSRVPQLSKRQALEGLLLPRRARQLLRATSTEGEDRSNRLYELAALLAEVGAEADSSFVLLRSSIWNKFKGRDDEVERLWEAVDRAQDSAERGKTSGGRKLEVSATRIDKLLARDLPKSEWAVERIWEQRGWGFIAGEPKTYKSTFSCDLAVSLATGTPFLGHFPVTHSGPVLIVQEENTENIQWARLSRIMEQRDLGGKLHSYANGVLEFTPPSADTPVYCIDRKRFSFTNKKKRKALEADIKALEPVLVILDPLQRMMGELSVRSESDVTQALDWLDHVQQSYKTGVLLVHHYHKRREEGPMEGGQRMLGSQALHAWLSCGLYIQRVEGSRLRVSREFRAFADGGSFELEFESEDDQDFYHTKVYESLRTERQQQLIDILHDTPWQTADELAEKLGVDRSRIQQYAEKLKLTRKKRPPQGKKGGRPQIVFGAPRKTVAKP